MKRVIKNEIYLFLAILTMMLTTCRAQQTVSRVIDGDTFVMESGETIRLACIDAPEIGQPYGEKVKRLVTIILKDEKVFVNRLGTGYYGRTIAKIDVIAQNTGETIDLGEFLVRSGSAWLVLEYCEYDKIKYFQKEAIDNERGLWKQKRPISPWEYRKNQ